MREHSTSADQRGAGLIMADKTHGLRVAVVGWALELPAALDAARVVSVREFIATELPPHDVLVLSDHALSRLDPAGIRARTGRTGETVVLVPVSSDPCRLVAWGQASVGTATPPHALGETLARLRTQPVRPSFEGTRPIQPSSVADRGQFGGVRRDCRRRSAGADRQFAAAARCASRAAFQRAGKSSSTSDSGTSRMRPMTSVRYSIG